MKAGTFNPLPEYKSGPFRDRVPFTSPIKDVRNNKGMQYKLTSRVCYDKSWVHPSIIETNLKKLDSVIIEINESSTFYCFYNSTLYRSIF